MDKINLVKNTIDNHDIDRLIDWLKGYPRLTKGELNLEFEKKFANWMGRKYAIFCNSVLHHKSTYVKCVKSKVRFQSQECCSSICCLGYRFNTSYGVGFQTNIM